MPPNTRFLRSDDVQIPEKLRGGHRKSAVSPRQTTPLLQHKVISIAPTPRGDPEEPLRAHPFTLPVENTDHRVESKAQAYNNVDPTLFQHNRTILGRFCAKLPAALALRRREQKALLSSDNTNARAPRCNGFIRAPQSTEQELTVPFQRRKRILTPSKKKAAPSRSPRRRRFPPRQHRASALPLSALDASWKHSSASLGLPLSSSSRPMLDRARAWARGVETDSFFPCFGTRGWAGGT